MFVSMSVFTSQVGADGKGGRAGARREETGAGEERWVAISNQKRGPGWR